ncbi:hypothetical protein T190_08905 [Sinorhizobium meliloti CCBAU 01290]|nr:hypothetical protein T190_08905 [Sinorhizobium meliloti CCBAU 01290]
MGSEENTIVAVAVAGGSAADDAAANTDRFNVPVAPIHVSRPKSYEDAPAFGADATGVGAAGKCRQEVAGLFSFLSEQASMITSKHERMKA